MKFKNEHKTLLILDIDETLIFATHKELERQADFKVFSYYVYKRPYLNEFLDTIKDHFTLAIWSSASDDYVEQIVKQIIPSNIDLAFVWGRSRATFQRNWQMDEYGSCFNNYSDHYHYTKPLKKVRRRGYKLSRILIVDDSPHKLRANFGNAIYPKVFNGDTKDNELKLLAQYLLSLKNLEDIRRIEKRNWQHSVS